jgi:hypothetical protein
MNANLTDITIVLDRSGSMMAVASETIGGFNHFLDEQKSVPGQATLTLNQFDDVFERVIDAKDIQAAPPLSRDTFKPRGYTALLDAIGRSINETGRRLAATPEPDRPGKVIVVIITDGKENRSREFTRDAIDEMIRHQREKYAWEFVFLGANQDAIDTAGKIGIKPAAAMTFAANSRGTSRAFKATTQRISELRLGRIREMAFTQKDRDEQKDAGA